MSTSVVVVAHRAHRWLPQSLESVVGRADEVILVDNGSADAAVSAVGCRLEARVLRTESNLGFTGGANLGIASARSEIVAFLNDDAVASPDWLPAAMNTLADESIAAVAPKTVFAFPHAELRFDDEPHFAPGDPRPLGRRLFSVVLDGVEVLPALIGPGIHGLETGHRGSNLSNWRWTTGREPVFVPLPENTDPRNVLVDGAPAPVVGLTTVINNAGSYLSAEGFGGDRGLGCPDNGGFDVSDDCFAASGMAMVVRRETLLRLGCFADRFFAYYEDLDWCWRARLAGLRVRYNPEGVVKHVGGVTSGGPGAPFVRFLAARNRILTLGRNAPPEVLLRQSIRALNEKHEASLARSLAGRLPEALVQRRRLARHWRRTPSDLWHEWAGMGEGSRVSLPRNAGEGS